MATIVFWAWFSTSFIWDYLHTKLWPVGKNDQAKPRTENSWSTLIEKSIKALLHRPLPT